MAVPPSNPNTNRSTTPVPFTSAQAQNLRQLLQFLHSTPPTTPNGPRPLVPLPTGSAAAATTAAPSPVSSQPLPTHQQNITIDASTRIIGHGNQVAAASLSSTEHQVTMIKELFGGVLQTQGEDKENATADTKANVSLNVVIQAGVNLIGSRNVVAFKGNGNGIKGAVCNEDNEDKNKTNKQSSNTIDNSKVQDATPLTPRSTTERKRRAESEPAVSHDQTTLSQKKLKAEE